MTSYLYIINLIAFLSVSGLELGILIARVSYREPARVAGVG